ncbi:MAG: hypothetical protein ACTSU2_06560 [Promethearchaeota archaeon]
MISRSFPRSPRSPTKTIHVDGSAPIRVVDYTDRISPKKRSAWICGDHKTLILLKTTLILKRHKTKIHVKR